MLRKLELSAEQHLIVAAHCARVGKVKQAVGWAQTAWAQQGVHALPAHLTLLQCTSAYPAPDEALNLRAIANPAH